MKKALQILVAVSMLLGGAALLISRQDPAKEKLMSVKAGYSHRLLDAVVQEDFETIRVQAFRLRAIAETGDWKLYDDDEYVHESEAFIRATVRLADMAAEKNGEGTALAYMDLLLTCVRCHHYAREQSE